MNNVITELLDNRDGLMEFPDESVFLTIVKVILLV
jgi:hypothetical protein